MSLNEVSSLAGADHEEIRQRFGLDESSHQKHFFKRLVEQPVKEVIEKTDLQIDIEKIKDNQRRGNPLARIKFIIKCSSV